MKQICGYCLKEFEGRHCECHDGDKRTFFSNEIDFKLLAVDTVLCECGSIKWEYVGSKAYSNRHILNHKCVNCKRVLGSETFFTSKAFKVDPRDMEYDNLVEEVKHK